MIISFMHKKMKIQSNEAFHLMITFLQKYIKLMDL